MGLKSTYVQLLRVARGLGRRFGLLARMERSRSKVIRHLRSLMAIYDAEDMASLGLPWWTYRAIDEVDSFLASRQKPRVFEYGTGASTLWLSERAAEVFSVEHDAAFAATVSTLVADAPNVTVRQVSAVASDHPGVVSQRRGHEGLDFTTYVDSIAWPGGTFDLIVVDGRARTACFERALGCLRPGGLVLFDDIRRNRYQSALEVPGLQVRVLGGWKPAIPFRDASALVSIEVPARLDG